MRQTILTLLLACTWSLLCYAQTPYDSFAPEAYRPMLELVKPTNPQPDTIFSVVVADLENQMLLLMNVHNGEILAAIPLSDDISKWLSVDPLSDKYPNISPYAYCGWNPVKHVDPDGRIAVAASALAQNRLLGTLSCGERKYVSFDKNGNINAHRLNRSKSTSHNMTALKALTNSKVTYNFLVQGKSSNGKTDMKQARGVTEMYGPGRDASPDPQVVNIISGDHLEGMDAAINMAHEAFGHAYMYELTGGDAERASHHYEVDINKSYIGEDGSWNMIPIDANTELQLHINEAVNETKTNYDCGL